MKNKQEPKFKKGDWGYADFELYCIESVGTYSNNRGHYYSISSGIVSTSTDVNEFFPLTFHNKIVSEAVQSVSKRIHKYGIGLNYPDIHRKLEEIWIELIKAKGDEKLISKGYDRLYAFERHIDDNVQKTRKVKYEDIDIFK